MRSHAILTAVLFVSVLAGCASPQAAPAPGVPGLSAYYEQATAPHRRAVRKPVRDVRERALAALARRANELRAESVAWDTEARGRRTSESRPARLAELRLALGELSAAARRGDVPAVERSYRCAVVTYQRLGRASSAAP